VHRQMLHVGVKVLQAGVEGPCFHRPGNWLLRQLNEDPKPVYKVGFIRKEMLQLEKCSRAQKPVTPCSGEIWGFYGHFNPGLGYWLGVFFYWPCICMGSLLDGLVCLPLTESGGGQQL
jgi:hypothetical protein